MSFNLKKYAADQSPVTEKQLRDEVTTDAPNQTHERQFDNLRVEDAPNNLSESQLESRRDNKAPTTISENQLGKRVDAPNQTHERQLDKHRKDGKNPALIEKTLHASVRAAAIRIASAFNDVGRLHRTRIALDTLKMSDAGARIMGGMDKPESIDFLRSVGYSDQKLQNLLAKAGHNPLEISALLNPSSAPDAASAMPQRIAQTAAAKDLSDDHTERRLRGESDEKAPDTIHEEQLTSLHVDTDFPLTEKILDKTRDDSTANLLTEGRLEKAKGGFHKHRNSDTSKGDINQVEALRLKDKKRVETEEAKPAAEIEKDFRYWDKTPGKDGIKLAQSNWSAATADFPINGGTAVLDPEIAEAEEAERKFRTDDDPAGLSHDEIQQRLEQQEQELRSFREVLREEEHPTEGEGENEFEITEDEEPRAARATVVIPPNPEGPAVMSSFEDVLVGQDDSTGTPVEQRALLFEKAKFSWANEDQIVDQALRYLRRKYPNAQLEEGSLSLNDDDADIGEVRFTLVDAAAAV